jgi:hypothetical protein
MNEQRIPEKFVKYLSQFNFSAAFSTRIEIAYNFYRVICPEEITAVHISDYFREDGSRDFESLWFFTDSFAMEAHTFLSADDFDIVTMKDRIVHLQVKRQDYDSTKVTESARLFVSVAFAVGFSGTFKAARENCNNLNTIMIDYFVRNLSKPHNLP